MDYRIKSKLVAFAVCMLSVSVFFLGGRFLALTFPDYSFEFVFLRWLFSIISIVATVIVISD